MQIVQLELNFHQQLQQAQSSPQDVDWQQLCLAFDAAIAQTPLSQQLALAAEALCEMAEVFALRAEAWFEELRYSSDDEPVLVDDVFADLIRQSMSLDLDDLVAEPELYVRSASEMSDVGDGSVVAYRDKNEVLAELESVVAAAPEDLALEASHEECVSEWVGRSRIIWGSVRVRCRSRSWSGGWGCLWWRCGWGFCWVGLECGRMGGFMTKRFGWGEGGLLP